MIASQDTAPELRALARALNGVPPPCWSSPDLWFSSEDADTAAHACRQHCHALDECRAYATTIRPQHGVWAGTDHQRHGRRKAAT